MHQWAARQAKNVLLAAAIHLGIYWSDKGEESSVPQVFAQWGLPGPAPQAATFEFKNVLICSFLSGWVTFLSADLDNRLISPRTSIVRVVLDLHGSGLSFYLWYPIGSP